MAVAAKRQFSVSWVVLLLCALTYVALVVTVARHHHPWSDEAEAWMVARNFGLGAMYFKVLRFEGHPGLWYTVMWLPSHLLHMRYVLLPRYAAAFASVGVLVLLWRGPFPLYLKVALPFSFYLAYQYAVVARGYVLFPLLVFLIADVYRRHPEERWVLAMLLGLLANLSFHGTLVAVGFVLAFAIKARCAGESLLAKRWRGPLTIFALFVMFAAVCIWPPRETWVPRTRALWLYSHLAVPVRFNDIPPLTAPPDPSRMAANVKTAHSTSSTTATAWNASAGRLPAPSAVESAWKVRAMKLVTPLTYAYSPWIWLGLLYQLLFVAYMVRSGNWMFLIPNLLLLLFLFGVYAAPWHYGMMFVLHVAVLWIVWDSAVPWFSASLQSAVGAVLLLLCVLQLPWTYHAARNDLYGRYFPGEKTAEMLRRQPKGGLRAALGGVLVVQPYFQENQFFNYAFRGVFYKVDYPSAKYVLSVRPYLVMMRASDPAEPKFLAAGYRNVSRECGQAWFPHGDTPPQVCLDVLRAPGPVPAVGESAAR